MSFTFNNAIPAAGNNPSSDQPDMLQNNISEALIWDIDHYGFNNNLSLGGLHKQVRMPTLGSIPSGLIANEITLYPKSSNGNSNLFFTNGNSGDEYQLTRANNTRFNLFGANINDYTGSNTDLTGGWTFLPGSGGNVGTPLPTIGGMIFQYGTVTNIAGNTNYTVTFPFPFTTACYAVTLGIVLNNTATQQLFIRNAVTTTSFNIRNNSSTINSFYWMAVGV